MKTKKLFVFFALLLAPSSAQADVTGGWPRPPRPGVSTSEYERILFTVFSIAGYAIWVAGFACFAWAGWLGFQAIKSSAAGAGIAAGAYVALGVTFLMFPFALAIVPFFSLPLLLSGVGLFWYLRRSAKAKAEKAKS